MKKIVLNAYRLCSRKNNIATCTNNAQIIYYRLVRIYSRKLVIHLLVLRLFFHYNDVSVHLSYLSFPTKTSNYIKKEKKKDLLYMIEADYEIYANICMRVCLERYI